MTTFTIDANTSTGALINAAPNASEPLFPLDYQGTSGDDIVVLPSNISGNRVSTFDGSDTVTAYPGLPGENRWDLIGMGPGRNDHLIIDYSTAGQNVKVDYITADSYGNDWQVKIGDSLRLRFGQVDTLTVTTGSGNDWIDGTTYHVVANDMFDGGPGADVVVYDRPRASYTIIGANGSYTISGPDGTDTLRNIEFVRFSAGGNVDLRDPPVITSDGGGDAATKSVVENTKAVTTVTATAPEGGGTLAYAIAGGADAALFAISATTGALTFKVAPDYEAPADSDRNNSYIVQVKAFDGDLVVTQTITVTVTNVPDSPPIIVSDGGGDKASISVVENTVAATTVTAADIDGGGTVEYSISGGADGAQFSIDTLTGALKFNAPPDFEAPTDVDANNTYIVQVRAAGEGGVDTQTITVTVGDVKASPVITSDGGGNTATTSVAENTNAVTTVTATSPDAGAPLTYAIAGGADAGLFDIDATTGALTFKVAPDFETPTDSDRNNNYVVQVKAAAGSLFDMQDITVIITDKKPTITLEGDASIWEGNPGELTELKYELKRSGDLSGVLDISWRGDSAGDPAFNRLDFLSLPPWAEAGHNFEGGFQTNGTAKFKDGDETAIIKFVLKSDLQPERDEGFTLSIQTDGSATLENREITTLIKNDDGPRNYHTLRAWAGWESLNLNTAGSVAARARGVLQEERDLFNVNESALLQAERYWYAVELHFGSGGLTPLSWVGLDSIEGGLGRIGFTRVMDGLKAWGEFLRTTVDSTWLENQLRSKPEVPTSIPSPEARAAFNEGVEDFWLQRWQNYIIGPQEIGYPWLDSDAASAGTGETPRQGSTQEAAAQRNIDPVTESAGVDEAATGSLPVIYVRSPISDAAYYVSEDGQPFQTLWTPDIPASGDLIVFDTIEGEMLQTGGGDDYILSGERADIRSGAGDDIIVVRNSGSTVDAGLGNDIVAGGEGVDTVDGGDGADLLLLGGGADRATGGDGADTLVGDAGDDTLEGGAGDDALDGGASDDKLDGGAGSDTAAYVDASTGVTVYLSLTTPQNTVGSGRDTLFSIENLIGSDFNDMLVGDDKANVVRGGAGADSLIGAGGDDTFEGGAGDDSLNGGLGSDTADYSTAGGAVRINLGLTAAQNTGAAGLDKLVSVENLLGTPFADTLIGNVSANTFFGGDGADRLYGWSGDDTLEGEDGDDLIIGDAGNDTVEGGAGNDRLYGGSGNDTMLGGAGVDTLAGGPGVDRLDGGDGADRLFADTTADTFVFGGLSGAGDRVFGFRSGVHTLEINAAGFGGTAGAFAFVANGTPTAASSQQTFLYDTDDGKLFFDADGTGAGGRVLVAQLFAPGAGAAAVAAADIDLL